MHNYAMPPEEWNQRTPMARLAALNGELFDALNDLKCQCVAVGAGMASRKLEECIRVACDVVDKHRGGGAILAKATGGAQ